MVRNRVPRKLRGQRSLLWSTPRIVTQGGNFRTKEWEGGRRRTRRRARRRMSPLALLGRKPPGWRERGNGPRTTAAASYRSIDATLGSFSRMTGPMYFGDLTMLRAWGELGGASPDRATISTAAPIAPYRDPAPESRVWSLYIDPLANVRLSRKPAGLLGRCIFRARATILRQNVGDRAPP